MTNLALSPALGWPLGTAICVIMLVCAVAQIVLHIRRRSQSDETVWACARRSMICALVAIMALTPSIVSSTNSRAINTTDVVVAVDVTGSMAVADAQYGSGTLDVPLTPDSKAIDNWADTLAPESTSISAGSTLDVPIDQLLLTCKSIHDQHPDDAIVLYLISDGEQTSSKTRRTFSSLRRYLSDAFTVAVGSEQGGNIPVTGDGVEEGDTQWVTDPETGEPGVSRMNADEMNAIADELSGTAIRLNATTTMSGGDSKEASSKWRVTQTSKQRTRTVAMVWPFAIAVALLLTFEAGAWITQSRRLL